MIQEKRKHKKSKKKPSAMAQVHNRVNAGVMDGVVYGGMMEEADPDSDEYVIGTNEPGPSNYFHVNENKKTLYITESQMRAMQLLLENEGTNLKKARNFLKAKGYDEQQRQELLDSLRHDIPNSRLCECKFMLGVVRLFLSRQLSDGRSIMSLNQVLKYIAMDAHVNEYDNNLNNENLDTLVERFRGAAQTDLQQSMRVSNSRNLTINNDYTIIPIETPEEAEKYADYVSWCVTQDENAFDSYTSGGLGRFYFCLRKNFKRAKEIPGEGCPLDNYGLSMIAVSVNEDGSLNTVTSRWNHANGGNDNIMSIEQLEDVLGRNFYQTFKPYTREELKAKGLTPLKEIPGLLAAGAKPEEIFKEFKPFGNHGIYSCKAGGKWNFIRNVNGKFELCFDKWFGDYEIVFYDDNGFEYAIVYDQVTQGQNYLLTDLSYLLDRDVTHAGSFENGYATVAVGTGETEQVANLIDRNGSPVLPKWVNAIRDFSIDGVDEHGMITVYKYFPDNSPYEYLDWKTNLISVKNPTRFLMDNWYDGVKSVEFYYGESLVNGYKVFRRKNGPSRELFEDVVLPDGTSLFGKEIECKDIECYNERFFIIRGNKDLLFSTVSGRFCGEYDQIDCGINNISYGEENKNDKPFLPIRVVKDGRVNYIGEDAEFLSDVWFTHGNTFIWNPRFVEYQVRVVKVELDGKFNFMDVNGRLLSNKWFDIVGNKWVSDDFDRTSENPRVLVRLDGKWYKLFLDGRLEEFKTNGIMSMDDYNTVHNYYFVDESKASGHLNEQKETSVNYDKYIKSLIDFMREQHLRIDPLPEIELNPEEQDGIFVKTGYYSPDEKKVVVFTDGRHPKDVLRTVAHEFVHHMQNLQNPDKDWGTGGDLEADGNLRGIEGEAFLLGNIIFREWTEKMKRTRELNESTDKSAIFRRIYAKNTYGTTEDFDSAGFILTNGELLDFGNYENAIRSSHGAFDVLGGNKRDFMADGNIRVNPESPGIELCKEPTEEQYDRIKEALAHWEGRGVFYVDCVTPEGSNLWNKSYEKDEFANVIDNLMNYFRNGESPVRKKEGNSVLDGYSLSDFLEEGRTGKRIDEITSEIVEPDDVDLSSFNIKKRLNPKFWDDGHLDTRIRLKLLDIADDFFASLGVDWVEPEDVIITGSLANYNWNKKYSDIDLHILVDYEDVDERTDFVREYFAMKKNEWNQKHEGLKIYGFPVEVYVQDSNEVHASSGVYSVDKDEWLTEPDRDALAAGKVNKRRIREQVSTYMNKIDNLIDIYKHHKDDKYEMKKVYEDAAEMMDEIRSLRKDALKKYAREMCDGNIIFKALRRSDYISKLLKLRDLAYDKINSI